MALSLVPRGSPQRYTVIKDVAPGNTVVGVPGRIVNNAESEKDARRQAVAKMIGFDAYGMHQGTTDPVVQAINHMLDHIHAMDSKMGEMCRAIEQLGGEVEGAPLPVLSSCEIKEGSGQEAEPREEAARQRVIPD